MEENLVIVPVIIGLVEVAKRIGLNEKYCPVLAVLLGIGFSALGTSVGVGGMLLAGIISGLTSVGLYSGVKNTFGK
jgi:hypothetical protein